MILHIETTTKNCSVALANDGQLIACKEISEENFNHAEKLHVFIEEILKEHAVSFENLKAIAVSKGPGSYTGLRIGVSAAKGLCYALQIPLIATDTLQTLAMQIQIKSGSIVAMLDARRMEVYTASFDENYHYNQPTQALILEKHFFDDQKQYHFVGDGAIKFQELVQENENFYFYPQLLFPSSKEMVSIAYDKFLKNDFEDVAYFEPFYLKEFILQNQKK